MKPVLFLAVALMLVILMFPAASPQSNNASKIRTVVDGPTQVLTGETYEYTIHIEKIDPTLDVDKWSFNITVEKGSANPTNGTSTATNVSAVTFKVNVTAPPTEGDFTITVNGTADVGNEIYWNKTHYKISTVKPYIIKAELYNSGSVEAKNVSVSLSIDGKFQYSTKVDLPPQKNQTVKLKFNPNDFSDGLHKARIVIDDSNHLTFKNGNTEMTVDIYLGEMHEDHTSTWVALAIFFGAGAIYAVISYQKKKKRMKRRKW